MLDYKEYCYPGSRFSERMVAVNDQVELRVISFFPATDSGNIPIIMVAGLSTIIESFRNILVGLTKSFPVHYIETREKKSAKIIGNTSFDIQSIGMDIVRVVSMLDKVDKGYALMGYSLGATVIVDCYQYLTPKPTYLLLMEPTPVFRYPKWSLILIRFAVPSYPILKPTAKWYLRKFRINTKEDMEMYHISSRALDNAEPRRLKNTILSIASYTVWHRLESLECPVLIVATSKDGFHDHVDVTRLKNSIKCCTYVDLETNTRTHSGEMATVIRNYLDNYANSSNQ